MKTLTETLENHKNTIRYEYQTEQAGSIPEVGETMYNDSQSMVCTAIEIDADGMVVVVCDNGQKVAGTQVAEMVEAGIIKIK